MNIFLLLNLRSFFQKNYLYLRIAVSVRKNHSDARLLRLFFIFLQSKRDRNNLFDYTKKLQPLTSLNQINRLINDG